MTALGETELLKTIHDPQDLKKLSGKELQQLCAEVRKYIIDVVSKNGGHLASNLGVVELTCALHLCFDFSVDSLVLDVGHQCYTHKLFTGRSAEFPSLRQKGGIAGFPKTEESPYDVFNTGHSSTAISAALGILRAKRLLHDTESHVVAVVGDGALTGGLAYEALDDAGQSELPLIVILNDNRMSIARNVGGMSAHLSKLRTSKGYKRFKRSFSSGLKKIPLIGNALSNGIERLKNRIKYFVIPNVMFEELGFTYAGPFDGHNIEQLTEIFQNAKQIKDKPVLIHVLTKKGKGYKPAELNPEKFHGVGAFDVETGEFPKKTDNSKVFASELCALAENDKRIVAITAAMPEGTGLYEFKNRFPNRFFDVGIAEQHGVTMAAGMAAAGLKPVFAVYSTFLQRGYDQLLHDVCLQKLPVVFGIDRAGLVGADGETHQGVYDIAYINTLPNGIKLFSPSSQEELRAMLKTALEQDGPCAIRYNRGLLPSRTLNLTYGMDEWEIILPVKRVTVAATGRLVQKLINIKESFFNGRDYSIGLVNVRLICPLSENLIKLFDNAECVITVEDGNLDSGFGAQLARRLSEREKPPRVINLGVPNIPIEAASVSQQDEFCHLTESAFTETIKKYL